MSGVLRVRVLLAEGQELYLEKLAGAIGDTPEFELVGTARDGIEALALIRDERPDVAVLEHGLVGLDGMAILAAVDRDELATRVVLLSAEPEQRRAYEAIGAGAACYLTRRARPEQIRAAVAAAAAGSNVFDDLVHPDLFAEVRRRSSEGERALDPELRRVLELTAAGLSPPEVADRMGVSHTTVKGRLRILHRRLEVRAPTAAAAEAVYRGLIAYPVSG